MEHTDTAQSGSDRTKIVRPPDLEAEQALAAARRRLLDEPADDVCLDRYVLLQKLGAGGAGVVFAAYDPALHRKVAIKLIAHGTDRGAGEARLLREARALAALSHPNIVTVHDVGTYDQSTLGRLSSRGIDPHGEVPPGHGVFLVMELVEGPHLARWLAQGRTRSEILGVFVAAGRGLAAAHEAGLVHRDFKPRNVLVGDGRVRVLDFGLAQSTGSAEAWSSRPPSESTDGVSRGVTATGAILGTPYYMAPEQHAGRAADPRTDQFSFCVALFEAICGQRPFAGDSLEQLEASKQAGPDVRLLEAQRLPRCLRDAILRGLEPDPNRRFETMEPLLRILSPARRSLLRRAVVAALLVGVGAASIELYGVAAAAWERAAVQQRSAACEDEGERIAEAWNDRARNELQATLRGAGVPHAEATAQKVMPWLDAQASAWRRARTEACLDAHVHHTWDTDTLDRALWCLDERRMDLEALVDALMRGNVDAVNEAVLSAAELSSVEPCRQSELLRRLPAPPTTQRDAARAVRADLARARALEDTAAFADALDVAREALARAEAIAWPPLSAAGRYRLGRLLVDTGDYEQAQRELEAAYFDAAHAGAFEIANAAAEQLVFVVGSLRAQPRLGFSWSRHAELIAAGIPDAAGMRRADHFSNLGLVHQAAGDYEDAKQAHERALAGREAVLGPDHPAVAVSLNNLAIAHEAMGSYTDAQSLLERAVAIYESALGPDHPVVARSLGNLAMVQMRRPGQREQAKTRYDRGLKLLERALGSEHPDVATMLNNLAAVYTTTGDQDAARRLYTRALAIREEALGPDDPRVATTLSNLSITYSNADQAKPLLERALAIQERALGPEHPHVARSLTNLGHAERRLGAHDEAERHLVRARSIIERTLGPDHPELAGPLIGLAEIALARGRSNDAVAFAEHAIAVREGGIAVDIADARFLLARALWDAKRSREHAIALAEQAREAYAELGAEGGLRETLEWIDAWLATHASEPSDTSP